MRAQLAQNGLFRCNVGRACVESHSSGQGTYGVFAVSPTDGVHGETSSESGKAGVTGLSRGTSGIADGVFGKSSNGRGVVGVSIRTKHAGIEAFGEMGDGISAESNGADAAALRAHGDNGGTAIFVGSNGPNRSHCVIDPNANLDCTGNIIAGSALESQHRNGRGERVVTYAPESATATIEDVGTARMSGGIANVRLDPRFAAMMDGRWYYVFLTPLGDTRGLYVSIKTVSGFQVRETERGRSNLEFDYRIVAHPVDAPGDRLPPAVKQP